MTEHVSPSLVEVSPRATISTLLDDRVARDPRAVVVERRDTAGSAWATMTAEQFADDVLAVARGLVARGVAPGEHVAIMSRTRYEWTLLDFAAWAVGAVPVPVYETSSADQVHWICSDADVRVAFVEDAALAATVESVRGDLPGLREVLVVDGGALDDLRAAGAAVPAEDVQQRRDAQRADDLATIIYTSGSTGRPKGVELTHRNFVHLALNGRAGLTEILDAPGARTLLFLPLAHVFARFIQVVVVASDAVLAHSSDTKNLVADLGTFRPTFLLAVPRVFEKVYNSAEQKARAGGKAKPFHWATKVAIAWSRAQDTSRGPSLVLSAQHAIADRLVYRTLRSAMGGQLTHSISGGAPLGERLGHFFRGVGLRILEGYGLTETTAPTAVNLPGLTKVGTVGPAFPGTALRIDDDGELLVQGDHVFRGYRNRPDLTAEALQDGWFRTGDLGSFDADGYLSITGRKKEIIVTAGGKNVAPAVLEDRLRAHPLVSQVVVVGDQRPFIGALVTLDHEMLPGWLSSHGLPDMDVATAAQDPQVLAALDRAVAHANEAVSRAESIRKISVLDTDFTEDNGYLTPSLKVKRTRVIADFTDTVDALYGAKVGADT
ncbi:AMP-dependent synthetase/ligase [Cellulosimicrobium marinum]|uniref:AMP-dependent synthetase/ligase n=1 Tax=Cellulosimicrobium marinum TaxID=1638992 RepID=UPI001E6478DD|nr:AMP-dependent synthetase/ligase [Cellulosimicrobium marinum]MCB7138288.1 AMP-dependent synthetase/ligase [Cellulosimicrobium marinum]